ncbi:MAG TPA: discoidin domain-containing protein [Flavisolibacter sp.]|nr:discoidin domain-containing protein [Flavisolibacter sp.]
MNIAVTKATGRKLMLRDKPSERYPGQHGDFSLVNGLRSEKGLSSPDWLGWEGKDLDAVIDFGVPEKFSTVRIHTIDQAGSWVYLPKAVEVYTSANGKTFKKVGSSAEFVSDAMMMGYMSVRFSARQARFLKIVAKNFGTIPEGLPGAGNPAWLMIDEIQVL